jgi:hypothetical protein
MFLTLFGACAFIWVREALEVNNLVVFLEHFGFFGRHFGTLQ